MGQWESILAIIGLVALWRIAGHLEGIADAGERVADALEQIAGGADD